MTPPETAWAYESGYLAGLANDVARLAAERERARHAATLPEAVAAAGWVRGYEAGRAAATAGR